MKILAIDPGYDRLGAAVVEGNPSKPTLVYSDCVLPDKGLQQDRLAHIANEIEKIISLHSPDAIALEKLFFGANKTTALKVGEARGTILTIAGTKHLKVIECSPQEVKLAVTGSGNADKKAVMRMVPLLILLPKKKRLDDEFDAIALGIAALAKGRFA